MREGRRCFCFYFITVFYQSFSNPVMLALGDQRLVGEPVEEYYPTLKLDHDLRD